MAEKPWKNISWGIAITPKITRATRSNTRSDTELNAPLVSERDIQKQIKEAASTSTSAAASTFALTATSALVFPSTLLLSTSTSATTTSPTRRYYNYKQPSH